MGFGCNPYSNTDFNGLTKEDAPTGSLPYPDFLKALKEKKVEGVVFQPPSGDVAFALIDGKSVRITYRLRQPKPKPEPKPKPNQVRIGEGWPVEISNSWSSPTWVVRILKNEGVPYVWNFDLDKKGFDESSGRQFDTAKYQKQDSRPYEPYVPSKKSKSPMRPDEGKPPGFNYTPSATK
eukprot:scaffold24179_cov90-Phaeocystis_antarctica.AAC.3